MITVETYIEIPGVFESTEGALDEIQASYGRTNWQAICDVAYLSPQGAAVDIDEVLGDLYFDPELQTFAFRVESARDVEVESSLLATGTGGEPKPADFIETRTETYEKIRAVSFLRQEDEDAS